MLINSNVLAQSGTRILAESSPALANPPGRLSFDSVDRANMGANISVMNCYTSLLGVLQDNITSPNSRIQDVDEALESTNFARDNILVNSENAMLAQANERPQSVLKLLQ